MRPIPAMLVRSPTMESYGVIGHFSFVVMLWFQVAFFTVYADAAGVPQLDLAIPMGMIVIFGVTFFAWMTLHAFGHVGMGSGAGLRLAMVATAARVLVSLQDVMLRANSDHVPAAQLTPALNRADWLRYASLVCYGCGIGLVVLASATDFARRRRHPRWMAPAD